MVNNPVVSSSLWLVHGNRKLATLYKVAESLDGQTYSKKFSVICAILYFVSAGFSFIEKKATGHHRLLMNCCSTTSTALSDTSLIMLVEASGFVCTRRVA